MYSPLMQYIYFLNILQTFFIKKRMSVVFWNDNMDTCPENNWLCDGICRSISDSHNIKSCQLRSMEDNFVFFPN